MTCRAAALIALLLAACGSLGGAQRPAHPVEGVRKVVDSLGGEIEKRAQAPAFRSLPVVIRAASAVNTGIELVIAELLRTRLVERGLPVEATCTARCLEISLQELAVEAPKQTTLSPGQVISIAGGQVPLVGGLIHSLGEQQQERERVASRASGLFVTLAARDGNRYGAREHVVAIISAGEIALE